LEKRVEESKKEYDYAKEKAKEAIQVHPVVQAELVIPTPSNGITADVPRNISSTTTNKYAFTLKFSHA